MKRLALLSVITFALVACLGSDFSDSVQGSWLMASGTVDGEVIPLLDDHPITMAFDGGRVTGTAACNSYSGTYRLSGSEISVSDVAMTEMACSPDDVMLAESMYREAITRVDMAALDDGLTLSGEGVELVFTTVEPVSDADLTNTVWVLDGLVQGDSVSTPVLDSRATIEFFTDGSVLGDTGCRPFSGRYTIAGDEVDITEMASDGHECAADLAGQDSHFLTTLGDGFKIGIEGDLLTISGQGDNGLVFRADA